MTFKRRAAKKLPRSIVKMPKRGRQESLTDGELGGILRESLPLVFEEKAKMLQKRLLVRGHAMEIEEPELQERSGLKEPALLDAISGLDAGSLARLKDDLKLIAEKSHYESVRKAAEKALESLKPGN